MNNFLEITSNDNWLKQHPEKIAGVEYETTSFYFPIMVKGTKEDVSRVTVMSKDDTFAKIASSNINSRKLALAKAKAKALKVKLSLGQLGVSLDTEVFKKMTVIELKDFTLNYYNTYLKGKDISVKNFLNEVVFVGGTGRKLLKPIYSEKVAIIENLEELIKNSTYNNWGNRKKTDSHNVLGFLNFKSKIIIDGIKKHVRISVVLYKNRETHLKNYEVGMKKEKRKKW